MALLAEVDGLIQRARAAIADDLTKSLRIELDARGIPLEQRRMIYLDDDLNIRYPDEIAQDVETWEFGLGQDIEPQGLLRKFANRVPQYADAAVERMSRP